MAGKNPEATPATSAAAVTVERRWRRQRWLRRPFPSGRDRRTRQLASAPESSGLKRKIPRKGNSEAWFENSPPGGASDDSSGSEIESSKIHHRRINNHPQWKSTTTRVINPWKLGTWKTSKLAKKWCDFFLGCFFQWLKWWEWRGGGNLRVTGQRSGRNFIFLSSISAGGFLKPHSACPSPPPSSTRPIFHQIGQKRGEGGGGGGGGGGNWHLIQANGIN